MKEEITPDTIRRYMLAIVPGEPVVSALTAIKHTLQKHIDPLEYQPPHITVFPAFNWCDKEEYLLVHHIKNILPHLYSFEVHIHGIACNRNKKTIFIPTRQDRFFNDCHMQFKNYFALQTLQHGISMADISGQLILANGDLKPRSLTKAWNLVKDVDVEGAFFANEVALLKKDQTGWHVFRQFSFD